MITLFIGCNVNLRHVHTLAHVVEVCHAAGIDNLTASEALGSTLEWGQETTVRIETTSCTRAQVREVAQRLSQECILVAVPGKRPRLVNANPNKADTDLYIETDL